MLYYARTPSGTASQEACGRPTTFCHRDEQDSQGPSGRGRMPVILISEEERLPTYKALLIFLSVHSQLCEGLLEMWWSGQMRWLGVSKS